MTQPTCPSAVRLLELVRNSAEFSPDHPINSHDDMLAALQRQGVDIENCDRAQLLGVIRDFFTNLSDEDLAVASGGEVAKAVAVAAAAAGAVAAVGVGVGFGVAGYYNNV
jgi:hypothetical protein